MTLLFGHLRQVDLRFEFFYQTAAANNRHLTSVFIHRTGRLMKHITGCLIVRDVLLVVEILVLERVTLPSLVIAVIGHIAFIRRQIVNRRIVNRFTSFFQRRVFLQFFIDTLTQLDRREFEHTNHLDLRGRQFGGLRQVLCESDVLHSKELTN